MHFPSIFATAILATAPFVAALPSNNIARANMCKIQASASHSYGGGGVGQPPIDNVSKGSVRCFNAKGDEVTSKDRKANPFDSDKTTLTAAECHLKADVTMHTTFNSASNGFVDCTATSGGKVIPGKKSTDITTNIVSVSKAFCTVHVPC